MTRKTVDVIKDEEGKRPDYDGDYHNATYHDDGTVTITIRGNPDKEIADAIRDAETLDELKSGLVGELTNAQVRGKRPDNAGSPGDNS